MLFLLQLLILTFFVVPNDSKQRHTLEGFIFKEDLLKIVEELSSKDENERNKGIYKMVKLFTGGKNAKKEDDDFTIPAEKAGDFLRKVFYALKYGNVIMAKVKKTDKKWICAENQPKKNTLKAILEGLFYVKFADQLKEYSKNLKPFLMILSAAIRICAIFGSEKEEYSLEAFLTAYKCANVGESQQPMIYSYKTIDCPTLTNYSYKILPIYKNDGYINNGQSLNFLSDKISSIKFCKTKTGSAERNLNFLLKLSDVDVTPFAIVKLAKDIRYGIEHRKMGMEIDKMELSQLVGAHFSGYSFTDYKKKNPSASMFQASLKDEVEFCLSNFLLNLLNPILNSSNLENYFVATDMSKELKAKQEETVKLYNSRFKRYNKKNVGNHWKDQTIEREHYLHFEDAIHINWNPHKETFILIQMLKYKCFCSTGLYNFVRRINANLGTELRNECDEMRESYELDGKYILSSGDTISLDEQNMLLKPIETLKNFEQIKKAYEKLKTFFKVEGDDKEEEDGYNAIVELNEEFGTAFKTILEEF